MIRPYLIGLGVVIELLALHWLNQHTQPSQGVGLAITLHTVACCCFAISTRTRFEHRHKGTGRLALFFMAWFLPLIGVWVFARLTAVSGRIETRTPEPWQEVVIPEIPRQIGHNATEGSTALAAAVRHGRDMETRLDALDAAAKLNPRAAGPILTSALKDPSEIVRKTAFELLESRDKGVYSEIGKLLEMMDNQPESLSDSRVQAEAAAHLWEFAYHGLSDQEAVRGFLQRAHAHLHRAIRVDQKSPELYFQIARVQLKLGDTQAARRDFETAVTLGQSNDEIMPYLAECAFIEQRYEQILQYLEHITPVRRRSDRLASVLTFWSRCA